MKRYINPIYIFRGIKRISRVKHTLILVAIAFNFVLLLALGYLYFTEKGIWWLVSAIPQTPRRAIERVILSAKDLPYIKYKFKDHGLEEYRIVIKKDKLEELKDNLPKSMREFLREEHKDEKKALFYHNDKEYEVSVRFRGTGSGHWHWQKKSWRIEFDKPKYFQGMHVINLIVPNERAYITEYFNNYRARKLGLTVPDDDFAILYVNGKKNGMYYQSEQWGADFIERQGLSPDTNFYSDSKTPQPADPFDMYSSFAEVPETWKKYTQNPIEGTDQYSDLKRYFDVLESDDEYFYNHIWSIVDKENFYSWYMHSKLTSSIHQYSMTNLRMYFDKEIGKFKFIPVDVSAMDDGFEYFFIGYHPLVERLLQSNGFIEEIEHHLWEYVDNESNLEDDLRFFDETFEFTKPGFVQDTFDEHTAKKIENNILRFRNIITRSTEFIEQSLKQASIYAVLSTDSKDPNNATLVISASSYAPIKLKNIELSEEVHIDMSPSIGTIMYPSLVEVDSQEYENTGNLGFIVREIFEPELKEYEYKITGQGLDILNVENVILEFENIITEDIYTINPLHVDESVFSDFDKITNSIDTAVDQHSMLRKSSDTTLTIFPGTYIVNEDIIIPKGVSLLIQPDSLLRFAPGISLISYGAITARASEASDIVFTSLSEEPWGVVGIIQAQEKSIFENAQFSNGSETRVNGAYFSGMLGAHYSDIEVIKSSFSNARADDALNVKYAHAYVSYSSFTNNSADAIDFDYVSGIVENSYFSGNGNDSIDLSGSSVLVQDSVIQDSGDKCISIGEKSEQTIIFNNLLQTCAIGIETKDASSPIILNTVIINNDTGINAYRKKPLFINGGFVDVHNSIISSNTEQITEDKRSDINIFSSNIQEGFDAPNIKFTESGEIKNSDYSISVGGNNAVLKELLGIEQQQAPIGLFRDIKL